MISVDDFPDPSDIRADIFVRWVKLTEIMGRISKMLCIRKDTCTSTAPLASELVNWVQSLPDRLQLQIGGDRTTGFNRDVHGLNLVYLATITLLNLRKNRAGRILPKAGRPAVVAASCIARIFEDYMARGSVRFLAGQAGWYIAVAILALLHARGDPHLQPFADRDIRTLRTALRQMASLWHSSKMFDLGFDKLVAVDPARMVGDDSSPDAPNGDGAAADAETGFEDADLADDINCLDYFPCITANTSPLIHAVLADDKVMPFEELHWPVDLTVRLQEFFTSPDNFVFDDFSLQG